MGLFRRAEQADTALSLWERINSISWVASAINLGAAAVIGWAAWATDWLNAFGPIAWAGAAVLGVFILAWGLVGVVELIRRMRGINQNAAPSGTGSAALRLMMLQNRTPQEISRRNVWRWYTHTLSAPNERGSPIPVATHIFITFDVPISPRYGRAISPTRPEVLFEVLELTERSMVIGARNVDLAGAVVEIYAGDAPN